MLKKIMHKFKLYCNKESLKYVIENRIYLKTVMCEDCVYQYSYWYTKLYSVHY